MKQFLDLICLVLKLAIAIQAYLKKQEKSQINKLTLHLKQLEKEEMKKLRVSGRREKMEMHLEKHQKEQEAEV